MKPPRSEGTLTLLYDRKIKKEATYTLLSPYLFTILAIRLGVTLRRCHHLAAKQTGLDPA